VPQWHCAYDFLRQFAVQHYPWPNPRLSIPPPSKAFAELNESIAAGDAARFTRAAHSIKGSSANLGAVALRGMAEKLEHHTRLSGLNDVAALIEQVKTEFRHAHDALATLIVR
jgi:HPt (histidine-containing phosphotransfer) domain-containing protein